MMRIERLDWGRLLPIRFRPNLWLKRTFTSAQILGHQYGMALMHGVETLTYGEARQHTKEGRMRGTLLNSLLELAHATSQNLGFAHRDDVYVSYGEETITETNLLELRRRHSGMIRLWTFGKKKEALNGADWEWHVIGRGRKLRMRVQAKRLQKDNKLKIPHKVASSGGQQINLLIADAKAHGSKPVYCLYASESKRASWQKGAPSAGTEEFEYGCLPVRTK